MPNSVPPTQIVFLRKTSKRIIKGILKSLQVKAKVDKDLLEEVAEFFLRDIYRIDRQQRESVSAAKFAGYWAFWVRKLKPISRATPLTKAAKPFADARSINEIVALQFGIEILRHVRTVEGFSDNVRQECSNFIEGKCDGSSCLLAYARRYLTFDKNFYHDYIIYSMRNRTFGPHHFALLLENMTFSSCAGINND
jgi:hypothetical protein